MWGRKLGTLFIRLPVRDRFEGLSLSFGFGSESRRSVEGRAVISFSLELERWIEVVVVESSGGEAWTSSAETATSNLKLSSIVPRLAAVAGRPSLAASSISGSSIPCATL